MRKTFLLLLLLQTLALEVQGWHDLGNTRYHCWNITADADHPDPFPSCPGIHFRWIVEPPDTVRLTETFNVTYELLVTSDFFPWAVSVGAFSAANGTGISGASHAEAWCRTTACPNDVRLATAATCCVYHVNVHSCSMEDTELPHGLCGPWVPPTGSIHTHSDVMTGPVDKGNWTSHISGLYTLGATTIIAHFKLAGFHLALEKEILVVSQQVCGDGTCDISKGEDCRACPLDCGKCPLAVWEVALYVTLTALAMLGLAAAFVVHKKLQKRRLFADESWIFSPELLQKDLPDYNHLDDDDSVFLLRIADDIEARRPLGSMMSMTQLASDGLGDAATVNRQIYTSTAVHDGKVLAIKYIPKKQFCLCNTIRSEVMVVRQLEHRNLCRFVGGCVIEPDVCILTEYCPKGSLTDVLLNDDLPLNWAFRFSFATEIARGMAYLHRHDVVHGRLTSSNCLVDDRWTVKISDFGLPTYRAPDDRALGSGGRREWETNYREKLRQVYRAPEVTSSASPTAQADVYAYAIILVEIATRNDPFQDEDPMEKEAGWKPSLPNLQSNHGHDDVCPSSKQFLALIEECWSDDPTQRPSFETAARSIQRINPSNQGPVDLMMTMMEKYSKDLEELVKKRTEELLNEKRMTDTLLYSMLPKGTADILRKGQAVQAEQFEACTIYFSDIVGFTTLAGSSSPMEVVQLLNALYSIFDTILEQYGVYKVETIGDAYMVVAGVPDATPFHAGEVANMALDLVDACCRFSIPHRPGEPLRIRVGLHSGKVVAGVVGLKMPRYCLFGDTVNTASRMESSGEPYKIHMSATTNNELRKLQGFLSERRGIIEVKGKGVMETWWLTGRTTSAAQYVNKHVREQEARRALSPPLSPSLPPGRPHVPLPSRLSSPSLTGDLHAASGPLYQGRRKLSEVESERLQVASTELLELSALENRVSPKSRSSAAVTLHPPSRPPEGATSSSSSSSGSNDSGYNEHQEEYACHV